MTSKYDWHIQLPDVFPATAEELLGMLLTLRGVPSDSQAAFFQPHYEDTMHDPSAIPDFSAAIDRIERARTKGEHIAVFGDYDVDGVTSSAILYETFRALGMHVRVMLPDRHTDGYGMSVEAVRSLVPAAMLLIAIDNGTNAHDAINEAKALGADVLVIDHHEVQGALPKGALVVNPKRADNAYPFPHLSAAGLALKVAHVLLERAGRSEMTKWLLDLAALGTLADRVLVADENRAIAQWGIRILHEQRRIGLAALGMRARLNLRACDADMIAFQLVPRLNAAGRMHHPDLAFQLLTTSDPLEADRLAATLEELNAKRKTITEQFTNDIHEHLVRSVPLPDVLCMAGPWPAGILGILAGRIAEEYGRPAVAIGIQEDTCVASVRGNGTVNMVDLLTEVSPLLTKFGGHAEAAGFSFPAASLPEVQAFFDHRSLGEQSVKRPSIAVDCLLPHALVDARSVSVLQKLEPHGEGNDRPLFALQGLVLEDVRSMGATGDHRRFQLSHPKFPVPALGGVAFRWGNRSEPERKQRIDVVGELRINRFQGRERLDIHVKDLRLHEGAHKESVPASVSERAA